MADPAGVDLRLAVAATLPADDPTARAAAGLTLDDVLVTGRLDLPEPPDAELRRAVRASSDLAARRAAELVADGQAQAVVCAEHAHLAAAAAAFVWGTQRGATAPVLVALIPRAGHRPLIVADLLSHSDTEVATALASVLARLLSTGTKLLSANPTNIVPRFGHALADPSIGVLLGSDGLAAGLVAGWSSAHQSSPVVVGLGLPSVLVVGPVAQAAPLARLLYRSELVGYTSQALADLVERRRAEAGLTQ